MELTLQQRFEKWAYMAGFDIEKHEAGTYRNSKTVAAMAGYYAATKECVNLANEAAIYYVEGSKSAEIAAGVAAAIEPSNAGVTGLPHTKGD